MRIGRAPRILGATAVVAIGLPVGLATWVDQRTTALAATLSTASGLPVTIGAIDADLTGTIRLSAVAFGSLVSADQVEASVAMSSLVGGHLRADEIRVHAPRIAMQVDADGDSDLARLARRLAVPGARPSSKATPPTRTAARAAKPKVRRIVVARGALTAKIAGVGELSASDVELVPDEHGVRVITGETRLRGTLASRVAVDLAFGRAAAEVAMPAMTFRRVLAVNGAGIVGRSGATADADTLLLGNVAAGRRDPAGALEVRATVDDSGTPREVALDLARDLSLTLRGERVPLRAFGFLVPRGVDFDRARGTGTVVVRREASALALAIDGRVDQLAVSHPMLAPAPIVVDAALGADLVLAADSITVPRLAFETGAIRIRGNGWARRTPAAGLIDLALESASCEALLASLPADLRGPLDGLVVEGDLGGRARLAIDLAAPDGEGVTFAPSATGSCEVLAEPPAADVTTLATPPLPSGENDAWVPLKSVPSYVPDAFVSAEDGRFWKHPGFDLEQIVRSLEIDLREARLARGGSTISQQLVKNAFLTHRRSLDRKLQEAILTWRLEARVGKKQILERYLNIIDLGPRVKGIREAARYWFDRAPGDLTIRQAAFLAALTSQPTTMSRRVQKASGLDPETLERVAVVLRAMRRDGAISTSEYDDAKSAPMQFASSALE